MKLSIIIPAHDAEEFISEQLEALARQQYDGDWEVIVSDNGSTDLTIEVADQDKNRFKEFRIIDSGDKRGSAHARNVAVRLYVQDSNTRQTPVTV